MTDYKAGRMFAIEGVVSLVEMDQDEEFPERTIIKIGLDGGTTGLGDIVLGEHVRLTIVTVDNKQSKEKTDAVVQSDLD